MRQELNPRCSTKGNESKGESFQCNDRTTQNLPSPWWAQKAKDVDADMDLCQSRIGRIIQEVGAKLRDFGKSAAKAHSDKGSFDTENVQQWWKEEQKRISQREIEGSRSGGQSRHRQAKTMIRFFKRGQHCHWIVWKSAHAAILNEFLCPSLMRIKPNSSDFGLRFPTALTKFLNPRKWRCWDWKHA